MFLKIPALFYPSNAQCISGLCFGYWEPYFGYPPYCIVQWHTASQEGSAPVDPLSPMCLYISNGLGEEAGFRVVLYSESWSRGSIRQGKNRPVAMESIKVPKFKVNLSTVTQKLGAIAWSLERSKHYTK